MASNWIPVNKRLPTNEDVRRNSGQNLFLVTAVFGEKGHLKKIVYATNFNVMLGSWDTCDNEIVTHWSYLPPPAIVELDNL